MYVCSVSSEFRLLVFADKVPLMWLALVLPQRSALEACHKGWGVATIVGVAPAGTGQACTTVVPPQHCRHLLPYCTRLLSLYTSVCVCACVCRDLHTAVPADNWTCVERNSLWRLEDCVMHDRNCIIQVRVCVAVMAHV